MILSDILSVKYTVDPKIDGRVTIQTPNPVARSEAVDLFQSALRANGASVIRSNGLYKIVPLDLAAVGGTLHLGGAPEPKERLGSRTQVVQLKYVSASEIRRVLEPISPRGSVIRTDDTRNIITLSGDNQDLAVMLDTISVFDVDVMKGMSFALIPVKTAQPDAIADELKTVFASDRDGPMAGMVRFLPNRQLGSILVMSAQVEYLKRAEEWVRRLDVQAAGSEKQFFTYAVQNRQAQELVDVLQGIFARETGAGRAIGPQRNVAPQFREASLQSSPMSQNMSQSNMPQTTSTSFGGSAMGGGLGSSQTNTIGSNFASARTSTPVSQPSLGSEAQPYGAASSDPTVDPRIKLALDAGKNAILVEATLADWRRVLKVIGTLDVMPNQVLIEATIAEISLNDELKFGVRWYLQGKNTSATFTDDAAGAASSVFPGFSYAITAAKLSTALNALNTITNVNVLSSPSLTVMDNRTALLQIGDEVPITTQSAVSVLTAGAPIVNSITYKDTGVILAITPRINASGRVLLDLEQEVSTVAATTTSGIDSPTISQRRIKTSVVVNNGEPLALGGMIQESKTVSRNQVPVLGDIPLIGNAFKQKDNTIAKTELVIIITPHIMRNLAEARSITDEFRNELQHIMPERRRGTAVEQTIHRTFE